MAHYYLHGDPIGSMSRSTAIERLRDDKSFEIVGVVGDAKYYEIRETTPRTIYFTSFQEGNVSSKFALRTSVEPTAVAAKYAERWRIVEECACWNGSLRWTIRWMRPSFRASHCHASGY